jgi:hypothetical protein
VTFLCIASAAPSVPALKETKADDECAVGAGEMLNARDAMDSDFTQEQIDNACRKVVVRYGEYLVPALAKIAEREAAARPR